MSDVANMYPHSPLQLQTSMQAIACTVRIGSVCLTVCSLCLPPAVTLGYDDLVRLIDQLPEPLIICTNAKVSTYYGGLITVIDGI